MTRVPVPRRAWATLALLSSACATGGSAPPRAEPTQAGETSRPPATVEDAGAPEVDVTPHDAGTPAPTDAAVAAVETVDAAAARPRMKPGKCEPERWGGWTGTAECRARANRIVPASHKPCTQDSECVLVGTVCVPHAVSKARAAAYDEVYACGNPRAGQCAMRHRAVCEAGCCGLGWL